MHVLILYFKWTCSQTRGPHADNDDILDDAKLAGLEEHIPVAEGISESDVVLAW
jgi:hypothetical protein